MESDRGAAISVAKPLTENERLRMDSLLRSLANGSKFSKEWQIELDDLTMRYEATLSPEQFKFIGRHR